MITFKQSTMLADIEAAYDKLNSDSPQTVKVPTSLRHGGEFGIPIALIQFFAYWSRATENPILKLHSSAANNEGMRALAQEPYGIAALYFASTLELSPENRMPTKMGLRYSIERIHAMQSGHPLNTMHGRGAFLACFAGAANEFLLPFYSKGEQGTLRDREDFSRLTEQLIDACAPTARKWLISPKNVKAISNLIYELFRNTDEHAQTDEHGRLYHRNVRGLMVKFTSINASSVTAQSASKDIPLNFFLAKALTNQRIHKDPNGGQHATENAAFLELSVFDTGPGLVKRWLAKHDPDANLGDLDIEREVSYVRKCFEEHATTKNSRGSGNGLDLVVSTLTDLNAFLKLRTGRVSLFQDFSSTSVAGFNPRHWSKNRHTLPAASGAAYSIVIPLSGRVN